MNAQLIKGQRYTFYYREPNDTTDYSFRANVVNVYQNIQKTYNENGELGIITYRTLIVNTLETEISKKTRLSTPMEWITRIENLDSILENHTNLPTDILNEIDQYI